jgi:hypothetical protein
LFLSGAAVHALPTGIHEAAHSDEVAYGMACQTSTCGLHNANDFMSNHQRITDLRPFATGRMNVGVAYTGVEDGDQDLMVTRIPADDGPGPER